jgi:hypothetical protein
MRAARSRRFPGDGVITCCISSDVVCGPLERLESYKNLQVRHAAPFASCTLDARAAMKMLK